jgi:hypothetical protein
MSREQGPRAQRGDATVANAAGRRRQGVPIIFGLTEASGMSREQGPRAQRGDATVANAAGRRQDGVSDLRSIPEAEA